MHLQYTIPCMIQEKHFEALSSEYLDESRTNHIIDVVKPVFKTSNASSNNNKTCFPTQYGSNSTKTKNILRLNNIDKTIYV